LKYFHLGFRRGLDNEFSVDPYFGYFRTKFCILCWSSDNAEF
jgi:hypothetical protein